MNVFMSGMGRMRTGVVRLGIVGGFMVAAMGAQASGFFSWSQDFPSAGMSYGLDSGQSMNFDGGSSITSLSLFNLGVQSYDSANDVYDLQFQFNLILNGTSYNGTGYATLDFNADQANSTSTVDAYTIDMSRFDLDFGGMSIRQSTPDSFGAHTIEHLANGGFWITSSLDLRSTVLTDGNGQQHGQNNVATDAAVVTPEPLTMSLGVSAIGLFVARRRKSQKAA